MEYLDIYMHRLSRYGTDYQSRLQRKREIGFEYYLARSVYRIEFDWEDQTEVGSFERYKQDETQTLHYLLTRIDLNIPNGSILWLADKDDELQPWMVYYLERIKASGYNRYVMLRMSHYLRWVARDGKTYSSWAYLYGQEDNMLKDELKSRSRMDTLYTENLKTSFFILPTTPYIRKDDYLIVGDKPLQEYFRVTGYDIQSSEGVEYVTIDPVYEFDLSLPPEQTEDDEPEEFYWLNNATIVEMESEANNLVDSAIVDEANAG